MQSEFKFFSDIYSKVTTGFLIPIVLKLNIPEQLSLCPKSIESLGISTKVNSERLHRYLLQLESNGIFSYNPSTKLWSNNINSSCLTDPNIKSMFLWRFSTFNLERHFALEAMLHSNSTALEIQGKSPFFTEIGSNPVYLKVFQECMQHFHVEIKNLDQSQSR